MVSGPAAIHALRGVDLSLHEGEMVVIARRLGFGQVDADEFSRGPE